MSSMLSNGMQSKRAWVIMKVSSCVYQRTKQYFINIMEMEHRVKLIKSILGCKLAFILKLIIKWDYNYN